MTDQPLPPAGGADDDATLRQPVSGQPADDLQADEAHDWTGEGPAS